MTESSGYWSQQARYDLETARAMLEAGRYLYVLFCWQQAVEKMLKSLIAQRSGELPPRIHQLVRLAEAAGLPITPDRADFLRELSSYYIQTRYPGEDADLASQVSEGEAQAILRQTEETVRWLNSTPA